jgi:hypothetical protein
MPQVPGIRPFDEGDLADQRWCRTRAAPRHRCQARAGGCLPYRPRRQLGAPAAAAAHSLVLAATGFIAAKDAVALRAWG